MKQTYIKLVASHSQSNNNPVSLMDLQSSELPVDLTSGFTDKPGISRRGCVRLSCNPGQPSLLREPGNNEVVARQGTGPRFVPFRHGWCTWKGAALPAYHLDVRNTCSLLWAYVYACAHRSPSVAPSLPLPAPNALCFPRICGYAPKHSALHMIPGFTRTAQHIITSIY